MKKILLTGGSGFVGSNVLPFLREKYEVVAPRRNELDVRCREQVEDILKNEEYDAVVHLASPSPIRSGNLDSYEKLFEDCLKIYMNFYAMKDYYGKLIYSGSGAEFDKRRDIVQIREEDFGKSVPVDDYGRAKYIMNELAESSENIYNLRIFGCFGPGEYSSKFITHAIRCCLNNKPITMHQNCMFDYLYVDNYADYLKFCIDKTPKFHDYNAGSGSRISLLDIATIVADKMNNKNGIVIENKGLNKEYTASNKRIMDEIGKGIKLITIEEGIDKLIKWEKQNFSKNINL